MKLRVLADDGSIHVFPADTHSGVIRAALARYHARPGKAGTPPEIDQGAWYPPMKDLGPVSTPDSRPGGPAIPVRKWFLPGGAYRYRLGAGPWQDIPPDGTTIRDTVDPQGRPQNYAFQPLCC